MPRSARRDAVGGKTANESLMVERMRIAAASGAGDVDTAARAFEAINASGKVGGPDKLRMIESIAGSYYHAREYAKALQWYQRYFKEGGTSGANRGLLIQTQYLSGDYAGAEKELMAEIQGAEKSGAAPGEDRINLLMNAAIKLNDLGGETFALERLVTYYPKKEYWGHAAQPLAAQAHVLGPSLARRLSPLARHRQHDGRQRLQRDGPARVAGRLAERSQAGGRQRLRGGCARQRPPRPSATSACVTW